MKRRINKIDYELIYKDVKNINIRVTKDLEVKVSANPCISPSKIDEIIAKKEDWILASIEKIKAMPKQEEEPLKYTKEESLEIFEQISDKIFPLFSSVLKEKPQIQVKLMKSRWGVCHRHKNRLVLNALLTNKPHDLIEYVILHEYAHFIHPNHQKGFHDLMFSLMPDYKDRRKRLKG